MGMGMNSYIIIITDWELRERTGDDDYFYFQLLKSFGRKKKSSVHKHVHLDVYHGHGDIMEANSSQLFWLPCYVMEKITRQQQKKRENDSRGRCRCFCWSSRSKISSIIRL